MKKIKNEKGISLDGRHFRVIFYTIFVIVSNLFINKLFPLDINESNVLHDVHLKLTYLARSAIRAGFVFIPVLIKINFFPKKEKHKNSSNITSKNYSDESEDYSYIRNLLTSLMIFKYFNDKNKN